MERYVVFDVETPNRWNNRMSAIGVSIMESGFLVREFYSLVNPEQPFDWFNTALTGISEELVADAPSFAELWPTLEPMFEGGVLVAHNASFDIGVLRKCLAAYGIPWKDSVRGLCTVTMGRSLLPGVSHRLNDLCDRFGICLNHHRADSDSRACALILQRYMELGADPEKYIKRYAMR